MAGLTAVLFDFDGTLSTLRAGWEEVMAPFMKEAIVGAAVLPEAEETALSKRIDDYIDESTGIQTIFQMRWVADTVRSKGWNPLVLDAWSYKAEYNRRLLLRVKERVDRLERGEAEADRYLMKGAVAFLERLRAHGIELYVASGTDHPDVVREAEVLGVAGYFKQIAGAPVGQAECPKEKVLADLIEGSGLSGRRLAVIGDGKVEIGLAKRHGALAIGLASDERAREGIDERKRIRLEQAGADRIMGDFRELESWLELLGLPQA